MLRAGDRMSDNDLNEPKPSVRSSRRAARNASRGLAEEGIHEIAYLSPASLVKTALKSTPAFKYAVAAAAIAALVATIAQFGVSIASLMFGTIALLVVMVIFLLFSQAVAVRGEPVPLPSRVMIWSFLAAGILASTFSFTSAFFNWPIPLRLVLLRSLAIEERPNPEQFDAVFSGTVNTKLAGGVPQTNHVKVNLKVSGSVVSGSYYNDAGDAGIIMGAINSNNLKLKFVSSKIPGDCDFNGSINSSRNEISALYRCSDDEHATVELKRNNAGAR